MMLDHVVHLDGRYQLQPQTIGIVGVQFRETDYTGNQPIGVYPNSQYVMSDDAECPLYLRVCRTRPQLPAGLDGFGAGGGSLHRLLQRPRQPETRPALMLMTSLKYTYLPESYLQFGSSLRL